MFLKKGMLAKLAVTRAFFEGTLRQSRQGITALAAVAAVKIEAYDLSGALAVDFAPFLQINIFTF